MTSAPIQVTAAKHLIDKGIPVNGAVALTCVLYFESKLNPGSQGNQASETPGVLNMHGAFGIASWNGPRQAGLNNFAMAHGRPVEDLMTQLDFVLNEMANHYPQSWAAIRSSAAVETIIPIIVAEYENPADHARESAGALGWAAPLYDAVKDYVAGPPSVPAPAPSAPIPSIPIPSIPMQGSIQVPISLIIQLVAPLAESLIKGLLQGALSHAQQGAPMPSAPAPAPAPSLPAFDFGQLAQLIAAELAKLQAPKP